MTELKIAIAKRKSGLDAAAGEGFTIIEETKHKFDTCVSAYDAHFLEQAGDIGTIDIGEGGWIALAKPSDV